MPKAELPGITQTQRKEMKTFGAQSQRKKSKQNKKKTATRTKEKKRWKERFTGDSQEGKRTQTPKGRGNGGDRLIKPHYSLEKGKLRYSRERS